MFANVSVSIATQILATNEILPPQITGITSLICGFILAIMITCIATYTRDKGCPDDKLIDTRAEQASNVLAMMEPKQWPRYKDRRISANKYTKQYY